MPQRPGFLTQGRWLACLALGFVAGLVDLVASLWLATAFSDVLRPLVAGGRPTLDAAESLAAASLLMAAVALAGRAVLIPFFVDLLAQPHDAWVIDRLADRAQRGDDVSALLVRGPGATEALRAATAIEVRTGTLVTLPLFALAIGMLATPLVLVLILALAAGAVPFYIWAGRTSSRRALALADRREQTMARVIQVVRATPTLRGLGNTDVGRVTVVDAVRREHHDAASAVNASLASSAVSEFLAGVGVGLVAMALGFGLFHRSALAGSRVHDAIAAVVLSAQLLLLWRSRGADFHAREARDAALVALATSPDAPSAGRDLVASDLVTLAGAHRLSFTLRPGDRVRVTGLSGSGKSTLLRTLAGLDLAVDGVLSHTLGPVVDYVDPRLPLLDEDLATNVALGRDAEDERVEGALRAVGLGDVAARGLHDVTVPRDLSDGERVRVLIARALYRRGDALVLDDVAGLLGDTHAAVVRTAVETLAGVTVIEAGHGPWLLDPTIHLEVTR